MKRYSILAAAAVAVATGLLARPALAADFNLQVSAPPKAAVGKPITLTVHGQNPRPDDYWFHSWLEVGVWPASVLPTCPAGAQEGLQVATRSGGQILAISMRETVDAEGRFTNTLAWTPAAPGRWLVCAYTDDGYTNTLALASATIDVSARAAKPSSTKAPRVRRAGGRLVCSRGSWSSAPTRYAYRWLVDGRRKRGATGRRLRTGRGLRGHRVQCAVTATDAAGSATATSRPLRIR